VALLLNWAGCLGEASGRRYCGSETECLTSGGRTDQLDVGKLKNDVSEKFADLVYQGIFSRHTRAEAVISSTVYNFLHKQSSIDLKGFVHPQYASPTELFTEFGPETRSTRRLPQVDPGLAGRSNTGSSSVIAGLNSS
jgi:hypothetical protein